MLKLRYVPKVYKHNEVLFNQFLLRDWIGSADEDTTGNAYIAIKPVMWKLTVRFLIPYIIQVEQNEPGIPQSSSVALHT